MDHASVIQGIEMGLHGAEEGEVIKEIMRRKKVLMYAMIVVLLISAIGFYIVKQNRFDMVEQSIEIQTPEGKLTGTLVLPKNATGKLGLVLFIHGDGAINATHDDGYKPLWERLASLGYASLSLNKRGIGGSEGNWLEQSMEGSGR